MLLLTAMAQLSLQEKSLIPTNFFPPNWWWKKILPFCNQFSWVHGFGGKFGCGKMVGNVSATLPPNCNQMIFFCLINRKPLLISSLLLRPSLLHLRNFRRRKDYAAPPLIRTSQSAVNVVPKTGLCYYGLPICQTNGIVRLCQRFRFPRHSTSLSQIREGRGIDCMERSSNHYDGKYG